MQTQDKLISILGTTASGKTDLALFIADQVLRQGLASGITLISADSRQVYQGLEITSGADIPPNFKRITNKTHSYFTNPQKNIQLHGVLINQPNKEWSVAHFRNLAINLIQDSWQKNWLPIIVGGTSFYHHQLFNNDPDIYIKPNFEFRQQLEKLNVKQLQQKLQALDSNKFQSMNHSDQHNPRRLIRAIEVVKYLQNNPQPKNPILNKPKKFISIGLQTDLDFLEKKIEQRVEQRINQGAINEIKQIQKLNLNKTNPVMTMLGIEPITQFINNQISKHQAIKAWSLQEIQYAKKQITWLKKLKTNFSFKIKNQSKFAKIWDATLQAIF